MLRVGICQPVVAAYRVAVFDRLGSSPDLAVTVISDEQGRPERPPAVPERLRCCARAHDPEYRLGPFLIQWGPLVAAWRRQFDVLVMGWNARSLVVFAALLVARWRGVRTVLWGHGYSKAERSWARALRVLQGRMADVVMFYDRDTAAQMAPHFRHCRVASNCLDLSHLDAVRSLPSEANKRATGRLAAPYLIHISRLHADNGLALMLDAMALDGAESLYLVVIGSGPDEASLKAQAKQLGLEERIEFVGAEYDERRIAAWMNDAFAMVYPRNAGLSLLHAFAYAVPVLVSNQRGSHNPEIAHFRDGCNGLSFVDGRARSLADCALRLLNSDSLRAQLAQGAAKTVAVGGSGDFQAMVQAFADTIRYCAELPPQRRRGHPT